LQVWLPSLAGDFAGGFAAAQNATPRNLVLFIPDGLRGRIVSPQTAPAMAEVRDKGVNFKNSHSLFPTFTMANGSAMASGHYLGDTGTFSNTIYTGYSSVPAGDTVVPFIENDAVLGDVDELLAAAHRCIRHRCLFEQLPAHAQQVGALGAHLGIRDGDAQVFEQIVRNYGGRLLSVTRRILRDEEAARDAVQEALIRAWRDLPGLRDPDRFDAWLHRLLVHACYREARRVKQREVMEIHMAAPDAGGSGDAQNLTALRDQLERGFRRLTPEQRAVLVVHHYLGLPLVEIADLLEIPAGTARSRLHYATRALRDGLTADAVLELNGGRLA